MMKFEHVDKGYEKQLNDLKDSILEMGSIAQEMIAGSQKALMERNSDFAMQVIKQDDRVDSLEMKIHEQCSSILALRQPAGVDLRFIILGLRIATDLERIGDSTKNISSQIIRLNKFGKIKEYVDLPQMFFLTGQMVHDSLDAFVRLDKKLALEILVRDDQIDQFQDKIVSELIRLMQKTTEIIEPATYLIEITHKIERIADHATNISEEVVYLIDGRDIRHGNNNGEI